MHDAWFGKLTEDAPGLKLRAAGRQYVANPLAIPSVGKRNLEPVRRSKNIHRGVIDVAGSATHMRDNAETWPSAGESAGDPVRNRSIEGSYPAFAEADEEYWSDQDCQEQAEACCDHGRSPPDHW
jgi:hypothetical protein